VGEGVFSGGIGWDLITQYSLREGRNKHILPNT
jgi:hypothetical protein